jgi:hypothetical protein
LIFLQFCFWHAACDVCGSLVRYLFHQVFSQVKGVKHMKTKFIAAIIAAMFPLGAIAQTAGTELGAGPGLAGSQGTSETEAGVRASGQSNTGESTLQRESQGVKESRSSASAGFRGAPKFGSSSRHTARADSAFRAHVAVLGSYAVDPIPDEGVAIGLQKNEG